jgi:hypothetical protein
MAYSIRLPDGTLVNNIPDNLPPEEAKKRIISSFPQYAPTAEDPISAAQRAADYGRLAGASAIQTIAAAPEGLLSAATAVPRAFATGEAFERGPLLPRILDKSTQLIRSALGTSLTEQQEERLAAKISADKFITQAKDIFELPKFFEYLSEEGGELAEKIRENVSFRTQEKLKSSTPSGNPIEAIMTGDFSKLSFGDNPTLEGYVAQGAQVLGSLAPTIATAILTKGAATPSAIVGAGTTGGEGAGQAKEYVENLSDSELLKMSPYYATMRGKGVDQDTAKRIISDRAAEQAAFLQGTVGALGGVFTGKLVTGKLDDYFTSNIRNRLGRIVTLGGVGALEEGTQEFLEGIAADVGINKEVVKEIGEDAFANLILGTIGGGGVGVVRGAISKTPKPKVDPSVLPPPLTPTTPPVGAQPPGQPPVQPGPGIQPPGQPPTGPGQPPGLMPGMVEPEPEFSPEEEAELQAQIAQAGRAAPTPITPTATEADPVIETPATLPPEVVKPLETAVLQQTPQPQTVSKKQISPPEIPKVGFKTEKGSIYSLDEQGRTSRTKVSEGKGKGTTYDPHAALYVTPEDAQSILEDKAAGALYRGKRSIRHGYIDTTTNRFIKLTDLSKLPAGVEPIVAVIDTEQNRVVAKYKAQLTPAIGLAPVEKLYTPDGMSNTHIGNKIVEFFGQAQPTIEDQVRAQKTEERRERQAEEKAKKGEFVLQNRDRSGSASLEQMQNIAKAPDYGRAGFSRTPDGAPIVSFANVAQQQLGRKDEVTTASGRKIPIQYAVVEADSVLASNDIQGRPNVDYGDKNVVGTRAIAGNGRITGLREAYRRGTAGRYIQDMANDSPLHGVSTDTISEMNNPVLVRIMPQEMLTKDIGDDLNKSSMLELSPVEQAKNDLNRVDFDAIEFDESGEINQTSLSQFINAQPVEERSRLVDQGLPTKQARQRLENAIFARAYNDDSLIAMFAQADDAEARLVINALAQVAPQMAKLEGAGDLDIRDIVTDAAKIIISGKRRGLKLTEIANQVDMTVDPDTRIIVGLFAQNTRSNKAAIEALNNAADIAYKESIRPEEGLFGAEPKMERRELVEQIRRSYEPGRTQDVAQAQRPRPAPSDVERKAEPSAAAVPPADQGFVLTGQTQEELAELERKEKTGEAQREIEEREAKELADRARDIFTLERTRAEPTPVAPPLKPTGDMFGAASQPSPTTAPATPIEEAAKPKYEIKRKEAYRGRTTPDIEYQVLKDGKILREYKRKKDAQQYLDILTLSKEEVEKKYPELIAPKTEPQESKAAAVDVPPVKLTYDEGVALIGPIEGPARADGPNEKISLDDQVLLRKMVVKTINEGIRTGKTREQIVGQIESLTKGGIGNAGMQRINTMLEDALESTVPDNVKPGSVIETIDLPDNMQVRILKATDGFSVQMYDKDSDNVVDKSVTIFKESVFEDNAFDSAKEYADNLVNEVRQETKEAEEAAPKAKPNFYQKLLPKAGFTRLNINNPRTYKNKSGDSFLTFERDGVRVAFESGNLLYADEKGRAGRYLGNDSTSPEGADSVFAALIVDPKDRKQGKARKALQEIVKMADESNTNLYLEPASLDTEGMTTPQLKDFYQQFGFKPQETAPATDQVMIRKAGAKAEPTKKTAGSPTIADMQAALDELKKERIALGLPDITLPVRDAKAAQAERAAKAKKKEAKLVKQATRSEIEYKRFDDLSTDPIQATPEQLKMAKELAARVDGELIFFDKDLKLGLVIVPDEGFNNYYPIHDGKISKVDVSDYTGLSVQDKSFLTRIVRNIQVLREIKPDLDTLYNVEFDMPEDRQESLFGSTSEAKKISDAMEPKGKKLPPGRSPELAAAARAVKAGAMTADEYNALVDKYRPIPIYAEPLKPATSEQVFDALDIKKREQINPVIPNGTKVGLRLDIPAFNRRGVFVVSIHQKRTASAPGKVIGYGSVAKAKNVTFGVGNQLKALDIATGEAKDALQTIEGEYINVSPEQALAEAQRAIKGPQLCPDRH